MTFKIRSLNHRGNLGGRKALLLMHPARLQRKISHQQKRMSATGAAQRNIGRKTAQHS